MNEDIGSVNDGNKQFYAALYSKKEGIVPYYTAAGLESHKDLKVALDNDFLPANKEASILVIGAGDGREIKFLQLQGYSNIKAIECNQQAVEILTEKFGTTIDIIQADIKQWQSEELVDCAIWMWCGFSDFSREEQKSLTAKVISILVPGGVFVLDNAIASTMMNVEPSGEDKYHGQTISHFFETPTGEKYRAYVPTSPEIRRWANKLQEVINTQSVKYATEQGRERQLFCFKKNPAILPPEIPPYAPCSPSPNSGGI